jgi:hypothetical protein
VIFDCVFIHSPRGCERCGEKIVFRQRDRDETTFDILEELHQVFVLHILLAERRDVYRLTCYGVDKIAAVLILFGIQRISDGGL